MTNGLRERHKQMSQTKQRARIVVGPGRLSFPFLLEPQATENGDKYSVTLLLPPGYDTKPLLAALNECAREAWGPDKAKWPKKARMPEDVIRDATEKSLAGYDEGWKFIAATSKGKPGIVDANKDEVHDPDAVYAGRWGRVNVTPYTYAAKGNVGISFGLNSVQILKNDKPFGGRGSAKNDFDAWAEEMEDAPF